MRWAFGLLLLAVAVLAFWWILRKLDQIHVLVNSRLTSALREVRELKKALGLPPGDDEES